MVALEAIQIPIHQQVRGAYPFLRFSFCEDARLRLFVCAQALGLVRRLAVEVRTMPLGIRVEVVPLVLAAREVGNSELH